MPVRALIALAVLAACGDKTAAPDAPNRDDAPVDAELDLDASVDAAVDAAVDASPDATVATGVVEVTVYTWDQQLAVNTPVLFQEASDAVVAVVMTDAQGKATATVPAGASVTALRPRRPGISADDLFTTLGVKPGDHLVIGNSLPAAPPPTTIAASVILPDPGATAYEYLSVRSRCGGGMVMLAGGTQTVPINLSCSPVDLYVETISLTTSQPVNSFLVHNVSVASGQTIDLSAQMFKPLTLHTLTLTNFPTTVIGDSFDASPSIAGYLLDQYLSHLEIGGTTVSTNVLGVADVTGVDLSILISLRESLESSQTIMRVAPFTGDVTMDVEAVRVPWVSPGTVDIANHRVTWTEAGTQPADLSRVDIHVLRGSEGLNWHVTGPHVAGAVELPVLGSTFAPFNLTAADAGNAQVEEVSIARFPDGWDGRRGNVFRDLSGFHYRSMFTLGGVAAVSSSLSGPYWGGASTAFSPRLKSTSSARAVAASFR